MEIGEPGAVDTNIFPSGQVADMKNYGRMELEPMPIIHVGLRSDDIEVIASDTWAESFERAYSGDYCPVLSNERDRFVLVDSKEVRRVWEQLLEKSRQLSSEQQKLEGQATVAYLTAAEETRAAWDVFSDAWQRSVVFPRADPTVQSNLNELRLAATEDDSGYLNLCIRRWEVIIHRFRIDSAAKSLELALMFRYDDLLTGLHGLLHRFRHWRAGVS